MAKITVFAAALACTLATAAAARASIKVHTLASASAQEDDQKRCAEHIPDSALTGTISDVAADWKYELDCKWVLRAPEGYSMSIGFDKLTLPVVDDCLWDYIEIRDGCEDGAPLMVRSCGTDTPASELPRLSSGSQCLTLRVRTDSHVTARDFQVAYEAHEKSGAECGPGEVMANGQCTPALDAGRPFNPEKRVEPSPSEDETEEPPADEETDESEQETTDEGEQEEAADEGEQEEAADEGEQEETTDEGEQEEAADEGEQEETTDEGEDADAGDADAGDADAGDTDAGDAGDNQGEETPADDGNSQTESDSGDQASSPESGTEQTATTATNDSPRDVEGDNTHPMAYKFPVFKETGARLRGNVASL